MKILFYITKRRDIVDEFNFVSNINTLTKGEVYHAKKVSDTSYIITMINSDGEWKMTKRQIEKRIKDKVFVVIQ